MNQRVQLVGVNIHQADWLKRYAQAGLIRCWLYRHDIKIGYLHMMRLSQGQLQGPPNLRAKRLAPIVGVFTGFRLLHFARIDAIIGIDFRTQFAQQPLRRLS